MCCSGNVFSSECPTATRHVRIKACSSCVTDQIIMSNVGVYPSSGRFSCVECVNLYANIYDDIRMQKFDYNWKV